MRSRIRVMRPVAARSTCASPGSPTPPRSPTRSRHVVSPERRQEDRVDEAGAIATVAEHDRGAYGFTMKTVANGFLHRVLPLRDPDQPRFWCVVVVRCTPGGLPD